MTYRKCIDFKTVILINNQSIWPIKIALLYRWIQGPFKSHFLFSSYEACTKRSSSLEKYIKGLKKDKKVWKWKHLKLFNLVLPISLT